MDKFDKEIKIIQELINRFGSLTRTKVVKLLYLLDVESVNTSGKRVTNFNYKKYYYGPYDEKIVDVLGERDFFSVSIGITLSGNQFYTYSKGLKDSDVSLDSKTLELMNNISEKYASKSLDEILKEAYQTEQFKGKDFGEKIF